MLLTLVPEPHHYPLPFILIGSFLLASLVVAIVTALDYRTWRSPSESIEVRKVRVESIWNRPAGKGGCIVFLMSMMFLISVLSAVLIADGML